MREHGVLNRVLLVYEEGARRLEGEEDPQQHAAGRGVTEDIAKLAVPGISGDNRGRLASSLHKFIRMYRPHEAREDTVLFTAFHDLVGQKEYERLGEQFEEEEHDILGENGFEKAVTEVAQLEKVLGIFDLAKFTPTQAGVAACPPRPTRSWSRTSFRPSRSR